MTRVIDLSIPKPRTEPACFGPLSRCNEIDRRRDRKLVRMPNDGPSPTRIADARKARERANAKRVPVPKTRKELQEEAEEAARLTILRILVESGGSCALSVFHSTTDMTVSMSEKLVIGMDANGLVEKSRAGKDGGGFYGLVTITDAGRDYLEGVGS